MRRITFNVNSTTFMLETRNSRNLSKVRFSKVSTLIITGVLKEYNQLKTEQLELIKPLEVVEIDGKLVKITNPELEDMLPDLTTSMLEEKGLLCAKQEKPLRPELEEVLTERGNDSLFDIVFKESFHWRSGKPFVEQFNMFGRADAFTEFMHRYANSIKIGQKAKKSLEFSQNLRILVELGKHKNSPSNPNLKKKLDKLESQSDRIIRARELLLENPSQSVSILLRILSWLIGDCNREFSSSIAVSIFLVLRDLFVNFEHDLTELEKLYWEHTLNALSGNQTVCQVLESKLKMEELQARKWPLLRISNPLENIYLFQLKHCGQEMLRSVQPQLFEHRDVKFYPDKWQYDLLQLIDQDASVLVSAPTSTGKTFISFYTITRAMERMKSEPVSVSQHDDIRARVVFVAPTLALCNQMAATISDRYGSANVGLFVGVHRQNLKCDILICSPQILFTLLTHPLKQEWANNLLYAIFDEVQCVAPTSLDDQAGLSECYSKVLALINCPFLALSATISNPEQLCSWLESIHHRTIHLIPKKSQSIQPWNNLKRFIFAPGMDKTETEIKNPSKPLQKDFLFHLNPVSLIQKDQAWDQLRFSPEELLEIYNALAKVSEAPDGQFLRDEVKSLAPENFFSQTTFLQRDDCLKYQAALIKTLTDLQKNTGVWELLCDTLGESPTGFMHSKDYVKDHILLLLTNLKHTGKLPSLFFGYKQKFIEDLVYAVVQKLEALEPPSSYQTLPKPTKVRLQKNDDTIPPEVEEGHINLKKEWEKFQEEKWKAKIHQVKEQALNVNPEYSFLPPGVHLFDYVDLEYWLKQLFKETNWKTTHPFIKGLTRGIGAHHSGLPKEYKAIVETLFRANLLQVIITTPNLSLGLNMPCKSVVFLQDSQYLTESDCKQIEGRAGRRGFDNIGYSVFFDIPPQKIANLIATPLPKIQYLPLLDVDTALRMLILFDQSKDKKQTKETLQKLLKSPHVDQTTEGPSLEHQLLFRFSLEFLFHLRLTDEKGRPTGLAGLVSHTAEISPANFALSYVILNGSLDSICRQKLTQELMLVLASIIFVLPAERHCTTLPFLSPALRASFQGYNTLIRRLADNFTEFERKLSIPPSQFLQTNNLEIDTERICNSYAYDFFIGGNIAELTKNNGLSDSTAYYKLERWEGLLKKISTAIAQMSTDLCNSYIAEAFEALSNEFSTKFKNITY